MDRNGKPQTITDVPGAFSATGVDDPVPDAEYGDDPEDVQPDVSPAEQFSEDRIMKRLAERGRAYVLFELAGREEDLFFSARQLRDEDDVDQVDEDSDLEDVLDEFVRRVDNVAWASPYDDLDGAGEDDVVNLEPSYGRLASDIVREFGGSA